MMLQEFLTIEVHRYYNGMFLSMIFYGGEEGEEVFGYY